MRPALEFSHVTRRWRAGILGAHVESVALDDCTFDIAAGELVLVTGGAGAGKSTLLLLASGRAAPTEGEVRWHGEADPGRVRPQLIGARPWEYGFLTVRQALAFHADQLALGSAALPAPTRFLPLMATVGLRGLSRVRIGQLSALDRLRVVVAQALLASPALICCEEPFAFCGPDERSEAVRLLRRVAARGIAVIVASREGAAMRDQALADRTFTLERGRLAAVDGRSPMVDLDPPGLPGVHTVLELAVPSPDDAMRRLADRLPSLARRGRRLRVPLGGRSPESILATCRDAGVRVRASRVAEDSASPLPGPAADA